jgi:drug/metabolite transporter (DMT)-like permease
VKTLLCTVLALFAFAMNSVLCRLALGKATIDAASFSTLRLFSGAVMLLLILLASKRARASTPGMKWIPPVLLFLYAVAFAFAYMGLTAGTGALILFGAVQATMIISALCSGERPSALEWAGLLVALGGLVYLVLPGLTSPSVPRSLLMMVAGISWGFYSILGRGSVNPLAETARNFVGALPLAVAVSILLASQIHLSSEGALLAIASGAVTSGLGYVVWYAALKGLTATRAATVQLAVPVLAAVGGVVLLSESLNARLLLAGIMILGGIGLALAGRARAVQMLAEETTR